MNTPNLGKILEERGSNYGDFAEMALFAQNLKVMLVTDRMNTVQRECMDLICTKLARLVIGNPNHADSWVDIAGYAQLAMKEPKENENAVDFVTTFDFGRKEFPAGTPESAIR